MKPLYAVSTWSFFKEILETVVREKLQTLFESKFKLQNILCSKYYFFILNAPTQGEGDGQIL